MAIRKTKKKTARKLSPRTRAQLMDGSDTTLDQRCYEDVQDELADVPAAIALPPRYDVEHAATAALELARRAERRREAFAALDRARPGMLAALDDLPVLARAVRFVRREREAALALQSRAQVPDELTREGVALKNKMMSVLEYNVAGALIGDQLAYIRQGSGHRDLADDLARLAALYDAHAGELTGDTRRYDRSDASRSRGLADRITTHLDEPRAQPADIWRDAQNRVNALLNQAYTRVRRAVLFLEEAEDESVASLHAAAHNLSLAQRGGRRLEPAVTPVAHSGDGVPVVPGRPLSPG